MSDVQEIGVLKQNLIYRNSFSAIKIDAIFLQCKVRETCGVIQYLQYFAHLYLKASKLLMKTYFLTLRLFVKSEISGANFFVALIKVKIGSFFRDKSFYVPDLPHLSAMWNTDMES